MSQSELVMQGLGRRIFGLCVMAIMLAAWPAEAQTVASPWVDHHERAQSRIVAAESGGKLVAFVEIVMPDGWKTYWRNPGDAGGLPPSFDFAKSENVSGTRVQFPAPKRLTDRAGDTIGYKGRALFPVEIDVADAGKPVLLRAEAKFGICREVCIPLDATYELKVEPGMVGPSTGALQAAVQQVPRQAGTGIKLISLKRTEAGAPPGLVFEVEFPPGAEETDLFVEAPEGLYVPMPKRSEGAKGTVLFTSTFGSEAELKQMTGKELKLTLVSKAANAETTAVLSP